MKQLLVLLSIAIPFISVGQFDKYQKADSLFKFYRSPVIDNNIYNRLEKDDAVLYVGCYYTTDTAGKVITQKFIPLIDIGNRYKSYDSIWHSVITSITLASKEWLFNPILWEFQEDKKVSVAINQVAFQRPFTGRPRYFPIMEISGVQGLVAIDKISLLKVL